jgi:hypothetical protein
MTAVCSAVHTKRINTLCGQNTEFLNVTADYMYSNHWAETFNTGSMTRIKRNFASVVVTVITGRYCQVLQAMQPHLSTTQEGAFKARLFSLHPHTIPLFSCLSANGIV